MRGARRTWIRSAARHAATMASIYGSTPLRPNWCRRRESCAICRTPRPVITLRRSASLRTDRRTWPSPRRSRRRQSLATGRSCCDQKAALRCRSRTSIPALSSAQSVQFCALDQRRAPRQCAPGVSGPMRIRFVRRTQSTERLVHRPYLRPAARCASRLRSPYRSRTIGQPALRDPGCDVRSTMSADIGHLAADKPARPVLCPPSGVNPLPQEHGEERCLEAGGSVLLLTRLRDPRAAAGGCGPYTRRGRRNCCAPPRRGRAWHVSQPVT